MDQHLFNKKLAKISALADGGDALGKFSALERDLLLGYIKELYEIVLETSSSNAHSTTVKETSVSASSPTKVIVEEKPEVPAVETVAAPAIVHQAIQDKAPVVTVHAIPEMPHDATSIVSTAETVAPSPTPAKANITALHSDSINEIFAVGVISDLSDKLANSPVSDLNKAMGINERMFTQQELFGNDAQEFGETLKKLNGCQSFEEARQYLIDNIIYKYDWTADTKVKKAATFVRLVRRRYI